jgi:hypothetical protein
LQRQYGVASWRPRAGKRFDQHGRSISVGRAAKWSRCESRRRAFSTGGARADARDALQQFLPAPTAHRVHIARTRSAEQCRQTTVRTQLRRLRLRADASHRAPCVTSAAVPARENVYFETQAVTAARRDEPRAAH